MTAAAPFLSSSWYRVARRRPKLRDHTSVHRHRYRGNIWYVVQDHANRPGAPLVAGWIHDRCGNGRRANR